MNEIYSIQYEAKGNKEFILPFSIKKELEVVVWIGNSLQEDTTYNVEFIEQDSINKNNKTFGKVVFFDPVGSPDKPEIITLEKRACIERNTDFKDYTVFRADNLNFELDNFINIIKSLEVIAQNSVIKSKLEDKNNIVIFPKSQEGKGIYWGKNGVLLNTKNDINNLTAEDITLTTTNLNKKYNNLQVYLQYMDDCISDLQDKYITLEKRSRV